MSKNNTISVIIPTYNRADYLKASIDSVLGQSIPENYDLQTIVVDDGSRDKTQELVKSYGSKVLYKRIPHSGKPAVVRNVGLSMAEGALIAFQDSDDLWAPDKLLKQLPLFDNPEIIGAYGNAGYIDKDGGIVEDRIALAEGQGISGDIFYFLTSRNKPSFPAPSVILRKKIMDEVGPFNEKLVIATDTEYWIRCSAKGNFAYTDDILCYVRRHDSNISSRPSESGLHALYKHESNRINMYEQIMLNADLNRDHKIALEARMIELHYYVAELSAKFGDEKASKFENTYGKTYQKARKEYYGTLPKSATSIGLLSWVKRSASSRFPRVYARIYTIYKRLRRI